MIVEVERPGAARADAIVRAYLTEVASRWYGRAATAAEVDRALDDEPYDDLQGDSGVFIIAADGGAAVACAGVRFVGDVGELTKVFTLPEHRGRGVGSALLRHVEDVCRARGTTSLRLDTRAELAEACALYERLGFVRVDPFNNDPYSDRWYAKSLRGA
ncbi:GNAT family N-acetyltransferase [Curtobacterium sp. VKM Ac-1376]|uniref:GNAT family N-acetyltransferase n=1 Tax=Curtobacterium sp. VKM Ac-1376 TaxID=123312 RepID=UPI00188B77DB|nr:GNAT family N-acetyltransferase [Curtobacterium sp. VKM Ac-1376]MBF4613393.1 GNAT family N-acetyltransferase [Curtobacterium sp. VKM Ac-1376]